MAGIPAMYANPMRTGPEPRISLAARRVSKLFFMRVFAFTMVSSASAWPVWAYFKDIEEFVGGSESI